MPPRPYLFFPEAGTKLVSISFEKEDMSIYPGLKSAILAIASMPPDNILTAQADSSVNIWNLEEKKITTLKFGGDPLWFLATNPIGRICFASKNRLGLADGKEKILLATKLPGEEPLFPQFFSPDEVVAVVKKKENNQWGIRMLNFHQKTTRLILLRGIEGIRKMILGRDGRIIFIGQEKNSSSSAACFLYILTPEKDGFSLARINKKASQFKDVVLLGPRLLTCGLEPTGKTSFQVWGNNFFVQTELGKLRIKPF